MNERMKKKTNEKHKVTNLERGKRRRGGARLLEKTTVEAVVARRMSVTTMQQKSRRLILADLTVENLEIASSRNLCSVRRFKQQQKRQLPLIPAKLERDSSPKPIPPNRTRSIQRGLDAHSIEGVVLRCGEVRGLDKDTN